MSNYQSSFRVIDLKLDIEPSLIMLPAQCVSAPASATSSCSTMCGGA